MAAPQTELMDLIRKVALEACGIDLNLDSTPAKGGMSAELAPGYTDSLYYDKRSIRTIPVLFLSKGKDHEKCVDQLCRLCNHLHGLKSYPQSKGFVWIDAVTATEPNKIGRQEDGQWLYSAIVNMRIYF